MTSTRKIFTFVKKNSQDKISISMPETSIPYSNTSEYDHITINWCSKCIIHLITIWIMPQSITNSSPSFDTIINNILISIFIIGYDDSLIQFNIPLDPSTNCDQVHFQRLSRDDTCRGREQTFNEVVNIWNHSGGSIFLCH